MKTADLLKLSDEKIIEQGDFSEAEFDLLENRLYLKAAVLGWTGDPLKQPLESVAAVVRGILSERKDAPCSHAGGAALDAQPDQVGAAAAPAQRAEVAQQPDQVIHPNDRWTAGKYPWDRWLAQARLLGVRADVAELGRGVMRDAYQHGWQPQIARQCGWDPSVAQEWQVEVTSTMKMISSAIVRPDQMRAEWQALLDTDGQAGDAPRELAQHDQAGAALEDANDDQIEVMDDACSSGQCMRCGPLPPLSSADVDQRLEGPRVG